MRGPAIARMMLLSVALLWSGGAAPWLRAQDDHLGDLLGDLAELDQTAKGLLVRLVPADDTTRGLDETLFWHETPWFTAACTFPEQILVNGSTVIGPTPVTDPDLGVLTQYLPEGQLAVAAGDLVLQPGDLKLSYRGGKVLSAHAALVPIAGGVGIRCAQVSFVMQDAAGVPQPTPVRLQAGGRSLLRPAKAFNPLRIWLPVGVAYDSSFGRFRLDAAGRLLAAPAELADGVTVAGNRLLRQREAAAPAPAPVVPVPGLRVLSLRARTVFAETEPITLLAAVSGPAAGPLRWQAQRLAAAESAPVALAEQALAELAAGADDARGLSIAPAALAPGDWRITATAGGQRGELRLTVVPWYQRSAFMVHSMSCCTGVWPTDDAGLATLAAGGLQQLMATGHFSMIDYTHPRGPDYEPTDADTLLQSLLRHNLGTMDLTVARRPGGFYNEGLSYHHSYQPSVDRMVRRLQLFAQQTAEYPSWLGANLGWFPSLQGYVEGGVPTDAHVPARNAALAEAVRAAGHLPLSPADSQWYLANRVSADPTARARAEALRQRQVAWWVAHEELGWQRHNAIYADAVRAVRPDAQVLLYDNAGHDGGKRTRALFGGGLNAVAYETYTDYGDWPMSAGFATDWAHGGAPGRPVWLTTSWGTTPEGKMKSLFHSLARGVAGAGVPMQADARLPALARRARGLQVAARYGPALAGAAQPDGQVAILTSRAQIAFDRRAIFDYHAMYYHFTRLGFPPLLVADEDQAIPPGVRLLVLVNQQHALEPATLPMLAEFRARGGVILAAGDCAWLPAGAIAMPQKLRQLWELDGFRPSVHAQLWEEHLAHWRAPLGEALQAAGLQPLARSHPDVALALALASDAGSLRWVTVIADQAGTHSDDFMPAAQVPLSLAGTGWIVRNLITGTALPTSTLAGRTELTLDLETEPVALLACYRQAPASLAVSTSPARLGETLALRSTVRDAADAELAAWPLSCALYTPAGELRREWFGVASDQFTYELPRLETAGAWRLRVQELVTGLEAEVELSVGAAAPGVAATPLPVAQVVNPAQLAAFRQRAGEKLILLEPRQAALLPVAKALQQRLAETGCKSRIWQLGPADFVPVPMRWFPRLEDEALLARISQGELVGIRENMSAYIDEKARRNVPARGGWAANEPLFMVGLDCIVFHDEPGLPPPSRGLPDWDSPGGMLANSLLAVTPWLPPFLPVGRGQGRAVVVFSPFAADRQCLALAARDAAGWEALVAAVTAATPPPQATPTQAPALALRAAVTRPAKLPTPLAEFTPRRRLRAIWSAPDGAGAVLLQGRPPTLAFFNAQGQMTATRDAGDFALASARMDAHGCLWWARRDDHGALWLQGVGPDGQARPGLPAWSGGEGGDLPAAQGASFQVAPDGQRAAVARAAALHWGPMGAPQWQRYDDLPRAPYRYALSQPRFPTALTWSPDGAALYALFDTRPQGFTNMLGRAPRPTAVEAVLLDAATGAVRWRRQSPATPAIYPDAKFAGLAGFVAVAEHGARTIMADYEGWVHLLDGAGKLLASERVVEDPGQGWNREGPLGGVGVAIAPGGHLGAAAFQDLLVLAAGMHLRRLPLPGIGSVAVTSDGALAAVGLSDGTLVAVAPDGSEQWRWDAGGVVPVLAPAPEGGLYAGLGSGAVVRLDGAGRERWRLDAASAADGARQPLVPAPTVAPAPATYRPPDTLEVAQRLLQARELAAWQPAAGAPASEYQGRRWYPITDAIELAAPGYAGEAMLHLVYRRPPENRGVTVEIGAGKEALRFVLDLPTPEYRVLDLPLRGPAPRLRLATDGPLLLASATLYAISWPSKNLAYVSASSASSTPTQLGGDSLGGLEEAMGDLDTAGAALHGRIKDARIWVYNNDIDKVAGPWLPPSMNPLDCLDGQQFTGRAESWCGKNFAGAWLTLDLGASAPLRLIATYDRALHQSQVNRALAVFSDFDPENWLSGKVLAGAVENDQFWRLFPLDGAKLRVFGVQAAGPRSNGNGHGLAEIEAYR